MAASSGLSDTVKLFIDYGVNIENQDSKGLTAFSLAVKKGHLRVVQILLESGANVHTMITEDSSQVRGWVSQNLESFLRVFRLHIKVTLELWAFSTTFCFDFGLYIW